MSNNKKSNKSIYWENIEKNKINLDGVYKTEMKKNGPFNGDLCFKTTALKKEDHVEISFSVSFAKDFPYVFYATFESDCPFTEQGIREITKKILNEHSLKMIKHYGTIWNFGFYATKKIVAEIKRGN